MSVSTINKPGEDYNTLTLWEADKDGVLGEIEEASCYNDDGALNDSVEINGSTTTTTKYMKISSPETERHDGTEFGGGFRVYKSGVSSVLYLRDNYTMVEWIVVYGSWMEWANSHLIRMDSNQTYVKNNICRDGSSGAGKKAYGIFFYGHNHIYNNIVYNCKQGIIEGAGYGANLEIYNNVCEQEIAVATDTAGLCKNNIAASFGFQNLTHDYNASVDGSANGGNSIPNITLADEVVSTSGGSEDFHLQEGSQLIDEGVDLGSGLFAIDIDNRDRDAQGDVWDIGAHEYVVVDVTPTYPIARLRKDVISGYHCFMAGYMSAKVHGYDPLKLPDGTEW